MPLTRSSRKPAAATPSAARTTAAATRAKQARITQLVREIRNDAEALLADADRMLGRLGR